jgi:phosphate transport system permease protein
MRSARVSDAVFRTVLVVGGIAVSVLLVAIFLSLLLASRPALVANGLRFLTGSEWDPVTSSFHALPFVFGTLVTSFIAVLIAAVMAIALSILLGEYLRTGPFAAVMRTAVELLAGIPSVVYGFIGLFFLVPVMRAVQVALQMPPFGVGMLTAAILLAFMVLPYAASIGRAMISLVPSDLKEAAYSLGATRYEVIRSIIIPYARSGIIAGILLALGRAIGETMAVTMLIGNSNFLPKSLFSPANTMASVIANTFSEATGITASSLIYIGLVLFMVTTVVNIIGTYVIKKVSLEASKEVT